MMTSSNDFMLKEAAVDMKKYSLDKLTKLRAKAASRVDVAKSSNIFPPEDIARFEKFLSMADNAILVKTASLVKEAKFKFNEQRRRYKEEGGSSSQGDPY